MAEKEGGVGPTLGGGGPTKKIPEGNENGKNSRKGKGGHIIPQSTGAETAHAEIKKKFTRKNVGL